MKNNIILQICDLSVSINNNKIIHGFNLTVNRGEIHAIMGKNGSGKSTLAKVIAGHPKYQVTQGEIIFNKDDITHEEPEKRSHRGIFLGFQYPVEIPGVNNIDFLRVAYNSKRTYKQLSTVDPLSFFQLINQYSSSIDLDNKFLERGVNTGFSGGEKKKNEILQMALLNSELSILDEIDSGLDIDALKIVANHINKLKNENISIVIITHYQRILEYIQPDFIHIMEKGNIIHTGNLELAKKIEKHGYNYLKSLEYS